MCDYKEKSILFSERLKSSEDFSYVRQFDILQMIRRILTRSYTPESKYPLKKIDVSTLLLIGYFPFNSMSYFSYKLNIENGSFTYVTKKLEELKLIELVQDSKDKRKKVLILTSDGEEEVIRLRKRLNAHLETKFSKLDESEKKEFFECMSKLGQLTRKIYE